MRLLRAKGLAVGIFILFIFSSAQAVRSDDLDNIIFKGTISDSTGAALAGATVVARRLATGISQAAITDMEGRYRLASADPGAYSITAAAPGFTAQVKRVEMVMGRRLRLDFQLAPAGIKDQTEVAASRVPPVDASRTVTGDTLVATEVEALPIFNRDPLQLIFLLGGATEAPLATSGLAEEGRGLFLRAAPEETGLFSLTGAPATSNNLTIDGVDNNDDRAARERIAPTPESVEEVQVVTNQYSAEYGRASGGRINIRTRGGANSYHAAAYLFFGDESLNANTFFRNSRGLGRVPQQERREGATVSGPFRRQKHFFFSSFERLEITDSAEIRAYLPLRLNPVFPLPLPNNKPEPGSPVALLLEDISTPETRNILTARVDLNSGLSHNAMVRIDLSRGGNRRGFSGGARLPETVLVEGRNTYSLSASDNLVISSRAINQARFQYSRLMPRNGGGTDRAGVIIEDPSRVVAGGFTGSASSPAFARQERRAQAQDTLLVEAGRHRLKLGGDLQCIRSSYTDLFATGGQYTFDSVEEFLANSPRRFVQRFNTASRLSNDVAGLFAQDEWKLKADLTLSVGLRWDGESIVSDRDNFSPRLAVAWDPFAKMSPGKTVIRGGFGIFYNRALLRTIDDFSIGGSAAIIDSEIDPELLTFVRFPDPVTDEATIKRFGVQESGFLRRVSPTFEIPYTLQAGFGLEREIGRGVVATADYIFTRGAHLWRETNINAPVLPAGFTTFTDFLLSRDFDNRGALNGARPVVSANADVVRFDTGTNTSSTAGAVKSENGLRVLTLGLNAPGAANIRAALNALRPLRPDPSLTQVELLEATGNSFYHGGIFSAKYRLGGRATFRAVYTLSKLIDEGTTNTASAQDLADRRAERALSLQDQRHRVAFSGVFQAPLLKLELAPVVSLGSSRPFNIGTGADRNLNDIENDRPVTLRSIGRPAWRRPGAGGADDLKAQLAPAAIGSGGTLPRNYGRGPGTKAIGLRASRALALGDKVKLRPAIDIFNLFNNTTFSFGSEFIDRDDSEFLVPRRTQRPRTIHLSVKLSF